MAGFSVDQAKAMIRDNPREMRRMYTKMRDIAQKRLGRLAKSEFSESAAYRAHARGFAKIRDISPENFAKALSELSKFVSAKSSSVSGQREIMQKTIATWRKQGLNLNASNYADVIRVLERMRKDKVTYGSDKAVESADIMMELDDSAQQKFLDNLGTMLRHLDDLQEIPELRGYNLDDVIEKWG